MARVKIRRVLIANRGEIAARIARTCRELGIETVLARAENDRVPTVARLFDRVVSLGEGTVAETYLNVDRIIDVARGADVDAIHPGYGFLSERAAMSAATEDAGMIFVGPTADVIEKMGSKSEARRLMHALDVPVVPGYDGEEQSLDRLKNEAEKIGFPLLVKASAGGGGKGMKLVESFEQLDGAIESARREAEKSFGDGTLLLERFMTNPRHVEFQIFGDGRGDVVHLFERDCSVQRRHQKVIEESPAPRYSQHLRERMARAAISAAAGIDYRNAGTVEFIVSGEDFFFLEMNTRLQVEHPVTELVVGTDLVRAQFEVAAGERLPWRQEDLAQRGHAIECRIYAEDPDQGYLPQTGVIGRYREPEGPGIRVDSGVGEGTEIGVTYDPLLAKLICHASDRDHAIERSIRALREFVILGTTTNIGHLRRVMEHEQFRAGTHDTTFIARHEGELEKVPGEGAWAIAAVLDDTVRKTAEATRSGAPAAPAGVWERLGNWGR